MTLDGLTGLPGGPLHLALGVFDGVHRGHQALIGHLAAGARAAGATAVAVTFDPLPIQVLAPGAPPSALSDAAERLALLRAAGAGHAAALRFDAGVAMLSPGDFLAALTRAGEVRRICVGADFRFGRDRSGDLALLRDGGRRLGYDVDQLPAVRIGDQAISSTRIRNLLRAGEVAAAADLLGRPYDVPGTVVHGEQRGRGLGYPTLNLETPPDRLLPADGIYAMWIEREGQRHPAAASLGVRPTFGGGPRRLEAYLLDFEGDLYGARVRGSFVERLRGEQHFADAETLAEQIRRDVLRTRAVLSGA